MPKDYINDYSSTAGSNTDVGGININEGCPPSSVNDAIREVMSHLAGLNTELDVGADVASAATLPLNVPGMMHDITGTTTITSFAEATNDTSRIKILQFDGALTLTHHATDLVLLTGANRTTTAGDIGIYYQYAAGDWREVYFSVSSSSVITTRGDIIRGDSSGDEERLSIGANGQLLRSDGTDISYSDQTSLATSQASTSGTSIDFTSIPAGTKAITFMAVGQSANATNTPIVQIGDSGGFETSGYDSTAQNSGSTSSATSGFILRASVAAASANSTLLKLSLVDASTFTWIAEGATTLDGGGEQYTVCGSKSLSGELTQLRLTTTGGTATFDAGKINIQYHY